jgi:hypothetical protein
MPSGQDVSEYLDTLGLFKSYFFKFFEKKIKKIERKKCFGAKTLDVWTSGRPRGSGDLSVCRIAC